MSTGRKWEQWGKKERKNKKLGSPWWSQCRGQKRHWCSKWRWKMQGKGRSEKRWSGCLMFPADTTITPPGYLQVYAIALRVPSDLSQISPFTVFIMEGIEGQGSGVRRMGQEAFPKPRKPYWIFKSVPDIKDRMRALSTWPNLPCSGFLHSLYISSAGVHCRLA